MWSQKFHNCISCGTKTRKHVARGLCVSCYQKDIERKHLPKRATKGFSSEVLTKEFLIEHYGNGRRSLSEIAKYAKCSRQFVHKKIKEFTIPLRNKSKSRELALEKGKIKFLRSDKNGNSKVITLNKNIINENFFDKWSPQMAYVLGVVCTDGNISPGISKDPKTKESIRVSRLTISQKEAELLLKVLRLMESETKLLYRKKRKFDNTVSGETYYFHLNSDKIYDRLINLGLTPNKSLTLKFPDVPDEFVNHFLRGCWDGDGSVYIDKASNSVFASFVSGSIDFISGILLKLYSVGLPERTLHKNSNSYYFRYTGNQCKVLGNYLYEKADETMWLNRKYEIFKKIM